MNLLECFVKNSHLRYYNLLKLSNILGVGFLLITSPLAGQDEDALKAFFEGKQVIVKLDMPARSNGVDINPMKKPPINFNLYYRRLRDFGVSVKSGQTVLITKIKKKTNHIEFQLDGGGMHDPLFGKKTEGDSTQLGSRFNIRYNFKLTKKEMTPESVMAALAEYVEFPRKDFGRSAPFAHNYTSDLKKTVVRLRSYNGQEEKFGTGFIFMIKQNKAFVLTANHVVTDNDGFSFDRIVIEFEGDGQKYNAEVFISYEDFDIAVLSLDNFPDDIGMIKLGISTHLQRGDEIYIHEYPGGGSHVRDDGSIKGLQGNKILLDNIEPLERNSGGPLLSNESNLVIGIILQKSASVDNQYALEVNQVELLIKKESEFADLFAEK